MSRLETVRAELESARAENQRLETEKERLQEQVSTTSSEAEQRSKALAEAETERDGLAEECRKLKTLYEGVLSEMQQEQEKAAEESSELQWTVESLHSARGKVEGEAEEWERVASELHAAMEAMQEHKELEILHAVAEEKARWEAREHRLIALLEQLQEQLSEGARSRWLSQPQPATGTVHKAVSFAPGPPSMYPINTAPEPTTHTLIP